MNNENFLFTVWMVVGCAIIGYGIWTLFRKKAVRFWTFMKMYDVTDVKKYNRAVGILYIVYGAVFIALGIPLQGARNSSTEVTAVLGVIFEVVALMLIYALVITPIYKKK